MELYKALNIYEKGMTGDEIVRKFIDMNLVEYFTEEEGDEEGDEREGSRKLRRIEGIEFILDRENNFKIDYGMDFKRKLNVTHLSEMIKICIREGVYTELIDDTLKNISFWDIDINIGDIDSESKNKSRCLHMATYMLTDRGNIDRDLNKAMEEFSENNPTEYEKVLNGETVLRVNLKVLGRVIDVYKIIKINLKGKTPVNIDLQKVIYGAIYEYFSAEKYRNVVETVGTFSDSNRFMSMYFNYKWAIDNIKMGLEAFNRIEKLENKDYPSKNKIYKDILVKKLNLKEGDICLFSVGKHINVAQSTRETQYMASFDPEDKTVKIDVRSEEGRHMKFLNNNSFALSRIYKIEDEYLVIEVSYASAGNVISRMVPVKWKLFFPDHEEYRIDSRGRQRYGELVDRIYPEVDLDNVYNFVGECLVLMTSENCISLRHPTERAVPGTSLKRKD